MRINGQINGKCVELTINNCLELGSNKIKRRNFFDGNNFITTTGITKSEIEMFFDNPMLNMIDVEYHNTKPIIRMTYGGVRYWFEYETGMWRSSDFDKEYYCHSIRELVWDYIIGPDSNHIKCSFRTKQKMIDILNEL